MQEFISPYYFPDPPKEKAVMIGDTLPLAVVEAMIATVLLNGDGDTDIPYYKELVVRRCLNDERGVVHLSQKEATDVADILEYCSWKIEKSYPKLAETVGSLSKMMTASLDVYAKTSRKSKPAVS